MSHGYVLTRNRPPSTLIRDQTLPEKRGLFNCDTTPGKTSRARGFAVAVNDARTRENRPVDRARFRRASGNALLFLSLACRPRPAANRQFRVSVSRCSPFYRKINVAPFHRSYWKNVHSHGKLKLFFLLLYVLLNFRAFGESYFHELLPNEAESFV